MTEAEQESEQELLDMRNAESLAAPASSVRARRDRESPEALRYGGGSVTRIVAPMVVVGPGP